MGITFIIDSDIAVSFVVYRINIERNYVDV